MNKEDKIGHYNTETGEEIPKEVLESIQKETRNKYLMKLARKFKDNPYDMTLDEIETYRMVLKNKKNKSIKFKLKQGGFISLIRQDSDMIKRLDSETKAMLFDVSMYMNKFGVILYNNNKPVVSFEKLKELLEIGHSKWSKIKKDIDEFDIVVKRKDSKNRNVLVVNPLFCLTSTEIGEVRFISFGSLFKDRLDLEDYVYLCKKFDIIPEYE